MFLVNKEDKTTKEIKDISFKSCGLKERADLQEWIAKNPMLLGEELLIIQKEFDGFSDTNERLDVLAIDKKGNLVVIENKLDDSGKNVVWQAMKYAGYCSSLKNEDIKEIYQQYINKNQDENTGLIEAGEAIAEFLGKVDFSEVELNQDLSQRILLVAREFRKEVTNTVIWARKFGMNIQCVKFTPYQIGEKLIVDTDQIIPVKDIAEIMIGYDEKAKDEAKIKEKRANSELLRNEFWHRFLPKFNEKSDLFAGRNIGLDQYDHWFSTGSGISGAVFDFLITKDYAGVELEISGGTREENKKIFDHFFKNKEEIEKVFGKRLEWERLDDKKMSRIISRLRGVSISNREDWDKMMEFLTDSMIKLEKALRKYIDNYSRSAKK